MAVDITPEESALLDAIARSESAGSWNVIYGGSKFDDYGAHPAKYVTIKSGPNKGRKSSAAGKYQITKTTYDRVAPKLGITDFSPQSQQQIALYLAREKYGPNLAKDLADGKVTQVAEALSPVWTSLPGGIEQGTTANKFLSAYTQAANTPRPPGYIPGVASQTDVGLPSNLASGARKMDVQLPRSRPKTVAGDFPYQANGMTPILSWPTPEDSTVPRVIPTTDFEKARQTAPLARTVSAPAMASMLSPQSFKPLPAPSPLVAPQMPISAPSMNETMNEQLVARNQGKALGLAGNLVGGVGGVVPTVSTATAASPAPQMVTRSAPVPSASVRSYQQQLASKGFSPGSIDGLEGPRTQSAIKAFQQANGLVADGIVGPKTLAALSGNSSVAKPTVAAPKVITPPAAPAPSGGGNIFGNLWNGASTGIGNAFNTVKDAAAPVVSNVGNALKDDAIKVVLGTKAGRTMVIDGAIGSMMRGDNQAGQPVTRYNPSTGKWTTTGPAVKTQLSITPPMVTRASSTLAAKPAGFGSKGYSAEGLALKNMFRR